MMTLIPGLGMTVSNSDCPIPDSPIGRHLTRSGRGTQPDGLKVKIAGSGRLVSKAEVIQLMVDGTVSKQF
jgi:hypothetical protein